MLNTELKGLAVLARILGCLVVCLGGLVVEATEVVTIGDIGDESWTVENTGTGLELAVVTLVLTVGAGVGDVAVMLLLNVCLVV